MWAASRAPFEPSGAAVLSATYLFLASYGLTLSEEINYANGPTETDVQAYSTGNGWTNINWDALSPSASPSFTTVGDYTDITMIRVTGPGSALTGPPYLAYPQTVPVT